MADEVNVKNTRLMVVQGDITLQKVDAIVNAANSGLMGGGGVDGAIHRAGGPAIVEECRQIASHIGRLPAGQAVITNAGKLKAKYIIHTVGPVWRGGGQNEAGTLASCYTESLKLASAKGLISIAFSAISTGVYGYPADEASHVAVGAVRDYLDNVQTSLLLIQFVVYDGITFRIYCNELARIVI
ncbi:MAG: O-acetyl-ADP-ribose deacetylase [Dehalococcoidia bacterium]|nr:O-acetyl-ADP-ribose deacetylase [Dehalococcoidia bacterium]